MFEKGYHSDNFKSNFEAKRKKIRLAIKIIAGIVFVGIAIQIGALYYGYQMIQDNGGVKETAIKILREVNQIQKEAEIK